MLGWWCRGRAGCAVRAPRRPLALRCCLARRLGVVHNRRVCTLVVRARVPVPDVLHGAVSSACAPSLSFALPLGPSVALPLAPPSLQPSCSFTKAGEYSPAFAALAARLIGLAAPLGGVLDGWAGVFSVPVRLLGGPPLPWSALHSGRQACP